MMMFGQTYLICEYYNGSRPQIIPENVLKVCVASNVSHEQTIKCVLPNFRIQKNLSTLYGID